MDYMEKSPPDLQFFYSILAFFYCNLEKVVL